MYNAPLFTRARRRKYFAELFVSTKNAVNAPDAVSSVTIGQQTN